MNERAEQLAAELEELFVQMTGPFPYTDCRQIAHGKRWRGFIPDLSMYWSDIAGFCCCARRTFPKRKIEDLWCYLPCVAEDFFEQHPTYKPLLKHITRKNTPTLYDELALYEDARLLLLQLFREMGVS